MTSLFNLLRNNCFAFRQSAQIAIKLASIVFSLIPLFDFVQSHQEELLLILESTKLDLIEFILKRVITSLHFSYA